MARFGHIVPVAWGPIVFSAVTLLTLYPMQFWALDSSDSFLPPLRILFAYGVFFTFGWLLYDQMALLGAFEHRAWVRFGLGLLFFALYIVSLNRAAWLGPSAALHIAATGSLALSMWFLLYGFIGLFLRYLEKPLPLARYLADASYWMYLVHLPFTIVLPAVLTGLPLPAVVKFGCTLAVTTFFTIFTYHYGVRSTIIGEVLNGRRYPRALPPRYTLVTTGQSLSAEGAARSEQI